MLWQLICVERLSNAARKLLAQANAVRAATDIGVRDIGGRIASLFRENRLLLKNRDEQFVRVLRILQGENIGGIDLIQDRNFGVEVWIAGKGVGLDVADGVGCGNRVGAYRTDSLKRSLCRAVSEFDCGTVGLNAL